MIALLLAAAIALFLWPHAMPRRRLRLLTAAAPRQVQPSGQVVGPRRRHWRARQRREREMSDAVVPVIDLLLIAVGSGATPRGALDLIRTTGPAVVRPTLARVLEREEAGERLDTALLRFRDELGDSFAPIVSVLLSALRDGAPISEVAGRLSIDARTARRRQAEAAARRLPVQLMFPLVLCALPAVLVGAVVPLILVSFRSLIG